MKVVIAGLGAGGIFAAVTLRKYQKDLEIVFVDDKDFDLLHPCGLPYVLEGRIESFDSLKHALPEMGFTKLLRHSAKALDPKAKTLTARDMASGNDVDISYDKLIIATGSSAAIPPVPGARELLGKGVYTLDNYMNALSLAGAMGAASSAVVIGAGAIGLETAFAMRAKGKQVTLVEMLPHVLAKSLDPDMASLVQEYLAAQSIRLLMGAKVTSINGSGMVESVTTEGDIIPCGLVVLATGVRPNIGFIEGSTVRVGRLGIIVNEHMQTSAPDVYAIGDCVQTFSFVDGRECMMQLAVAAYKQAVVAARSILGMPAAYRGALNTFATRLGDMEIAATGSNSASAGDCVAGKASGLTKPEWCSGGRPITVKLLADKATGRILGAQAVGAAGAAERVNVVSAAIKGGLKLSDFSEIELAYCPEISDTYDILMQAADNGLRRMGV